MIQELNISSFFIFMRGGVYVRTNSKINAIDSRGKNL